jgi:hypothetical protein
VPRAESDPDAETKSAFLGTAYAADPTRVAPAGAGSEVDGCGGIMTSMAITRKTVLAKATAHTVRMRLRVRRGERCAEK